MASTIKPSTSESSAIFDLLTINFPTSDSPTIDSPTVDSGPPEPLAATPDATFDATPDTRAQPAVGRNTGLPRLSVVVVNYRQWPKTSRLVRQLAHSACLRRGDAEIVVVDNHSPPHPQAARLRRLPGVSLRRWKRNHGFARAVNEGCRLSQGDWFLLLNPDMTLCEGFLDRALALIDEWTSSPEADDSSVGIVGFHLRNDDGTQQLSTGRFPTLTSTLSRLILPRSQRKYRQVRTEGRCEVPWVSGCCLLVRRECLQALGGLDENFFLYYEDVDLCQRARQAGWSVWYEPGLAAVHHLPLHRRSVPAALRIVTRHSLLTYAHKHWPRWQFVLLAKLVAMEARLRRWLSWWRGDVQQANVYRIMAQFINESRRLGPEQVRKKLVRLVHNMDLRLGV